MENLDEEVRKLEEMNYYNWQRISFNLRKHLDNWSYITVKPSWAEMKLSYWPIICNIGIDGSTVSELSKKSMMPKQNISRSIKELESNGFLVRKINNNDKRSEVIMLTENGKKLILEVNTDVLKINDIYKEFIPEEDLLITVRVLNKILDYHDRFRFGEVNLSNDNI